MDFMNLNQAAHGDREFGFICTRLGLNRKVVNGYYADPVVQHEIGVWARVAAAWADSQTMKVARIGDNMREVAVTEGNKVSAQIQFGYSCNGYAVPDVLKFIDAVTDKEANALVKKYFDLYSVPKKGAAEMKSFLAAAKQEIGLRAFLEDGNFTAFTTTFENLYGLDQLPGLACQRLMEEGYGFGAEGDWKTAAFLRTAKVMAAGLPGGVSFMEDYTYHFEPNRQRVLGAHMLEVCPSLAADKPRIETHHLGIGMNEKDPARLVFEGKAGPAIVVSLIDMGGRLRLIVQDIECVKPILPMPNLPVARVMWRAMPDLTTGVECWITAGGAHHTVLSYDVSAEMMRDWARIMDIEFVHISKDTLPEKLEEELLVKDLIWKLR
jgi:L-arabinose isomerase